MAAVLDSVAAMRGAKQVVLADSTITLVPNSRIREAVDLMAGLEPSTRASFLRRVTDATASCRDLSVRVPVTYASRQSVDALHGGDTGAFWRAFYARYPGAAGFTLVTRAGLSADGRQALVLVENGCGEHCGNLALILLEASADGHWRLRHAEVLLFS